MGDLMERLGDRGDGEVEQVCDRAAVINRGRIVAQGAVDELLGKGQVVRVWVPAPPEAADLLQSLPGVNRIHANGTFVDVAGVPSENVILHLVSQGVVPSQVTTGQTDSEEVFFELTEGNAKRGSHGL